MTQTIRTTRRVYQRSPASGGDATLSNALTAVDGTAGEFRVTSETDRARLFDTGNPFSPAADFLGRVVSFRDTPPTSGTAGTNLHDDMWCIITAVDASGGWVELSGFRAEVAGSAITYRVHASVDFSAASAAFAIDEGPQGPNSAPFPAERTNTGPTVGQAVFFPAASNDTHAAQPYLVGALGPAGGSTSTTCRLVDWTGRFSTIPTGTSLRWELRDMPAYTEEMLWFQIHQFMQTCGWALYQLRGKNNGVGDPPHIVRDAIYQSDGENGQKLGYCRIIAVNDGSSTDGSFSAGSPPLKGLDFAMYGAWDRDFVNGAGINPGNGINVVSPHDNTTNRWASAADAPLSPVANQAPFWNPDLNAGNSGSVIGDTVGWRSRFHATTTRRRERNNALGTIEGGDLSEIHYTFVGDKDEVHLMAEASGFGSAYIGMGFLAPRADANPTILEMNRSATNGSNVTLRVGGIPGTPTSDGLNPQSPGAGLPAYQVGDLIQIAGKTVNAGIVPGTSHSGEFIVDAQITSFPGLLPAAGTIVCPVGSQVGDGDTIAISDGSTSVTFEFDSGGGVTPGNTAVAFTGGDSAATVATTFDAAITGSALNITVSRATATLTLTSGLSGAGVGAGNVPFVSSLTNAAQWTLEGMNGGGYSIQVAQLDADYAAGAKVGEDPDPIFIYTHAKSTRNSSLHSAPFTNLGAFVVNNRAGANDATYFNGSLPGGAAATDGFQGFECFGPLETVDQFGEANPNRRGGRFILVPVLCRDANGSQLRGSLKYLRFVSARVRDHKFLRDRQGTYHYIVPTYLQDTDGETTTSATAGNYVLGPFPQAHVVI